MDWFEIKEEDFRLYRNIGGLEFLGQSDEVLKTEEIYKRAQEVCEHLELTGLILTGASHTLTDAIYLSEHFLKNKCKTRVVVAPCTIDNNLNPKYIETSIGFDTSTKVFS